jgi:hypothetical protein
VTVLIGVGGTLAWQSYGDAARQIAAARAPTLGWLLSYVPTTSPIVAASAIPAQPVSPSAFDSLRRSVELLAARQDQLFQNIADLRAIEEDVRQKMSFTPASAAAALALTVPPNLQQKPVARTQSSAVEPSPAPRRPLAAGPVPVPR